MGSPTFYWYPDAAGTLQLTTLSGLSDLHESIDRERAVARGGDGSAHVAAMAGRTTIRVVRERGVSAALVRELRALEDHLLRGGLVGFSRDHAKSWAAYVTGPTIRGFGYFPTAGNAFSAWSAAASLASGDEVACEAAQPDGRCEIATVSSLGSTSNVNINETVIYTREVASMVRWRDFYPALRMADEQVGRPILTTEHRIAWTLDVTLEVVPAIITAGARATFDHALVTLGLGASSGAAGGELTLDALLGRVVATDDTAPARPAWQAPGWRSRVR